MTSNIPYLSQIEKMPDAVLLLNPKAGCLINCNDAALSLLGFPDKHALINRPLTALSPDVQSDGQSSLSKSTSLFSEVMQKGFHRFDWQYLRYDNSIILVEVTLTTLTIDDEVIFQFALRDITEIQQKITSMTELDSLRTGTANSAIQDMISTLKKNTGPEALSGLTVLIVEDQVFMQSIVAESLQLFSAKHVIANNGAEALEIIKQQPIDVVLMDLHMPLMDGFVATIEIRKIKEFAGLPIIALTASATDETKQRCSRIGMNGFVSKPIDAHILVKTIRQLTFESPTH